jgi:signal transduction histidine kinase
MNKGFPKFRIISLRVKILIPLVTLSTAIFLIASWLLHTYLYKQFQQEVKKRAETLAGIIIYGCDVSQNPDQIQRLVSTMNLEQDVNLIMVVSGIPPVIFASSRLQWLGQDLSSIPEFPERPFLLAAATSPRGYRFDHRVQNSLTYITSLKITNPQAGTGMLGNGALLLELGLGSKVHELAQMTWILSLGLFLTTLLVAIIVYMGIRRYILIPAYAMKEAMTDRAGNDPYRRVPVYYHDEIGLIARSVNEMLDQMERESQKRSLVEKRLRESEHSLRELNSTKDKFFSVIAHDLRSPFNSILGFTNLLLEEYFRLSPKEHLDFITRVHNGLSNVYKLLENLLEWSRIQLGGIEFHPESLDLGLAVHEVLSNNKINLEQKGIEARCEIPSDTMVLADENILKTILRNLVSNAIKFSSHGKMIRIYTVTSQEDDRVPEHSTGVAVADAGIGIPAPDLEKLFRIDSGFRRYGTDRETGTGLGLILCKEFAEKQGGSIWVKSVEGEGSVFIFTIPVPE